MLVYSTRSADLTDRLDPTHYRPDLVAIESAVRMLGASTLDRWVERSGIGHTAAVTPHYANVTEPSVPFVSGAAIKDGTLDVAGAERVRVESHNSVMAASRLRPGMLVAVRKGELGNAGIVPPGLAEANCSSEVIFFHLRNRDRAGYLASYFNSRHGRAVFLRQQRGMMIPSISLYDVPDILVPSPNDEVQAYIGSKVRQAEALREWARVRVNEVLFDYAAVERKLPATGRRHAKVPALTLRDRLDAEHYPDEVLQAFAGASSTEAVRLADVTADIFSGVTLPAAEAGASVRQATVATLDRVFLNDRFRDVQAPRSVGRPFATHDLAIAAAAHTASYIGKDVTYVVMDEPAYPSTEVLVVRADRDRIPASWLWCFLKSPLGYRQVQACVRGISAHAYPDDICEVIVPMPPDALRARFDGHDEVMARANGASVAARALVMASRILVEALIERKITEVELMAAGKDADADRALLARLAEDGLDGVGVPLFSNLDSLAELLAEAQRGGGDS